MKYLISSIFIMLLSLSGCNSDDSSAPPPAAPPAPKTVTVDIAPVTVTLDVGTSEKLRAIATDENGESTDVTDQATWALVASNGAIELDATDPSLVKALVVGEDSVTATFGGITSVEPTVVTVVEETLVSLAVTPADVTMLVGTTQEFKVVGTFNTERTQDMTAESTWESVSGDVFITMEKNVATAVKQIDNASITASFGNINAAASVAVFNTIERLEMTPVKTQLFDGEIQTFTAQAYFAGSTIPENVTKQVVWSSSDTEAIAKAGGANAISTFQAIMPGSSTIMATHTNAANEVVTTSQMITVDVAFLDRIEIIPSEGSVTDGNSLVYGVDAVYVDNQRSPIDREAALTMSVSDSSKAYIERDSNGIWTLTATDVGVVRVKAVFLEGDSGGDLIEHHDHAELTIDAN